MEKNHNNIRRGNTKNEEKIKVDNSFKQFIKENVLADIFSNKGTDEDSKELDIKW